MSAAPTNPSPPANAAPLTAAITGLSLSMIRVSTSGYGTDLVPSIEAPGGLFRSAPEQKAGGAPVITMHRTDASSFAFPRVVVKFANKHRRECVFGYLGRLSVIQAAPVSISYLVASVVAIRLLPRVYPISTRTTSLSTWVAGFNTETGYHTPSIGAMIRCSIFIASRMTRSCPARTF